MPTADTERLVAEGRLLEAAQLLERAGETARAASLYEQLWDHAGVMRCARAAGDLPRALEAALLARDIGGAEALLAELERQPDRERERAVQICRQRGALAMAARLLASLGQPRAAGELYREAGLRLEAAHCFERAGDSRLAIQTYRGLLEGAGSEVAESTLAGEDPRFRLGRLLLRAGRAEEALPWLQQAWKKDGYGPGPAGRAVVAALARLGYSFGAHHALRLVQGAGGFGRPSLADCLDDPDHAAPIDSGEDEPALAGRYRLGRLLGSGGMGRVYQATDLVADRPVAVKIFAPPSGARGRDAYRRFLKEASTAGQLRHPHIVALLDVNQDMGFMVFELMSGGTLADRLRPSLDLATSRSVLLQVIAGLGAAHQRGIVHRDIKPSNIFFTESGAAKLGDFGVAHLQDSGQTQTGAFVGTVAFMAPEQITGGPVSFATDIYALGVTLFLMLTGQPPFSPPDLIGKHLRASPPSPSSLRPDLPTSVDALVQRCLAKQPEDRFESLQSMAQALEAIEVEVDLRGDGPPAAAPAPAGSRRALDRRYVAENAVHDDGELQVLAARDLELGRPVLLVRLAPGPRRDAGLRLLAAAASGGDHHLQRVFHLDPDLGQAVLASPAGTPFLLEELDRQERLCLLEQLGLALAPLHAAGLAHGSVSAAALSRCGEDVLLSLVPALARRSPAVAAGDLQSAAGLLGLTLPEELADGAALASWAADQRQRLEASLRQARQERLLEEALACAPPGVDRR